MADASYGSTNPIDSIKKIYPKIQVISQLRSNQLVHTYGKQRPVEDYFKQHTPVEHSISIRGLPTVKVWMHGGRILVESHGKKRFVIALKYEGEDDYRYIVASDLNWRMNDIVETYSLRWLIEVFFQDWKTYEGWRELELQYVEGSEQAVILSLLFDYSLILHPSQIRVVDGNLPAYTVGSLIERSRIDAFLQFVRNILEQENSEEYFNKFETAAKEIFKLRESGKHMSGRILNEMEASPKLKYKEEKILMAAA
ncbi:MAG: transposase [Oligoflexia bacterium]|nr:transposase [Oligoflexia bacterium]